MLFVVKLLLLLTLFLFLFFLGLISFVELRSTTWYIERVEECSWSNVLFRGHIAYRFVDYLQVSSDWFDLSLPFVRNGCVYSKMDWNVTRLYCLIIACPILGVIFLYWFLRCCWVRLLLNVPYYLSTSLKRDLRVFLYRASRMNVETGKRTGHTHPDEANDRQRAESMITQFCTLSGLKRYDYQNSPRSENSAGWRSWLFAKDIRTDVKFDEFSEGHLLTMIDVDYYVDMPVFLDGRPVMIYTFTPEGVAGKTRNGSFQFTADGTVQQNIIGGAHYEHLLWDYNVDDIAVRHWWGTVYYVIHREKISAHRSVVLFMPLRKLYFPNFFPFQYILDPALRANGLVRREVVKNGIAISVHDTNIHMARIGVYPEIVLPLVAYHTALVRLGETKEPHISDAERIFNSFKVSDSAFAATQFFKMYGDLVDRSVKHTHSLPDLVTYQATKGLITEDGASKMRVIAPAMFPGYAPAKSYNNDLACVTGRLISVKNTVINERLDRSLVRFIAALKKAQPHAVLVPGNFDEHRDHLRTPNQKRKLEDEGEEIMQESVMVKSFQKSEAYAKITDPRNISTLPTSHNYRLGCYSVAFADILKGFHWYCPGLTPQGISLLVHKLAVGSQFITSSDVSRMDGSVSPQLRRVYEEVLRAFCAPEYLPELLVLLNAELEAVGFTTFGIKYNADGTILSGSSITSQIGSIINCFIAFCALEHISDDPYSLLGLYFGDDGLTADLDCELLIRVAASFGMKYESEQHMRGSVVKFLARLYLDPWVTKASVADVKRQCGKIHMTHLPAYVPRELILYRRAAAYLLSDPHTPILSVMCRSIMRIVGPVCKGYEMLLSQDASYWSQFSDQFEAPPANDLLALEVIADNCGLTAADIRRIGGEIREAKTLEDVFVTMGREAPKIAMEVVHAGEIKSATPSVPHQEAVEANKKPIRSCRFSKENCKFPNCQFLHTGVKPTCREFIAGNCSRRICKFLH